MNTVLLSDDELAAMAVRMGGRWMGPLPSVDESSPVDLLRAVGRGERSIALRGGVFTGSDDTAVSVEDLETMLRPGVDQRPTVLGYVARPADPTVPAGVRFSAFSADGGSRRLLAMTLPDGITEVSSVQAGRVRQVVRAFAEGAPQTPGEPRVAVIVSPLSADDGETVTVAADRITRGRYSLDGSDLSAGPEVDDLPREILDRA